MSRIEISLRQTQLTNAVKIMSEIEGLFDFLQAIYGLFGFTFKLKLSTRPEKYLGELETWNNAEAQLKAAMTKFKGNDWIIDEGDGAFYGPKIDITIADALKREFQCATIQLDYQAPINFKLEYMSNEKGAKTLVTEDAGKEGKEGETKPNEPGPGRARPVVIHRAIIGSFERFLGILIEHFGGKWPFWLSPRQILIVPVMPAVNDYVEELQTILRGDKLNVDIDISGNTMQKKIRTGQLQQYNFIFGKFTSHAWRFLYIYILYVRISDCMKQLLALKKRRVARSTSVTVMIRPPRRWV